ncbi:MAG: hypothetical protein ACTH2Y_03890 [Corynebacterium sp.]|uniref:hypothetical protein n=1 Tax=unclassified Corynebacterium TaxID=2624378 RepID=UPI002647BF04|nr:hypothetical protein [Corynebacterium sp.]MDN5719337.1 hypothetical protein [Corynebacterium sp.]MDN6258662.1 hypothetical protein [Corynebacterium sp.]MDN6323809.1 hypothetical protein [Corynebacterium sp.]MDN6386511.1 hypothetical protein [Corynebacterium sp.]MDN6509196.1 hypothetical protein [Corynebacterium sp.]
MPGTPDRRVVLTAVTVIALVAVVGVVALWWFLQSYQTLAGGLGESGAREHCGEEVRWETGFGQDAELDLWDARPDTDADRWVVDGQVFSEHVEGVEVTHGARDDGMQFRCLVSEDRVTVEMLD